MKTTTVYFGPYAHGPHTQPNVQNTAASRGARRWLTFASRWLANLAPGRQIDESGTLLVVETALCATLLGTLVVWLQGSGASVVNTMLSVDGLLIAWLLVGSLIQTIRTSRRDTLAVAAKPAPNVWAYRVAVRNAVAQLAGLSEIGGFGSIDWNTLEREAVLAADLEPGDLVFIDAGQAIVADARIVDGFAVVDESVVTGQSDPVLRCADGESTVLRDSRVVSGQILVRISPRRGHPLDWDQSAVVPAYAALSKPKRASVNATADV
jgi:high-affinity K+ transport system ATPase subunit B